MSLQQLIDRDELQMLQNELCRVAGVYACCANRKKESITELSNTGSGVFEGLSRDELQTLRRSPYAQRVLERVEPDSLEDTAVEPFPGGRVAALSITLEGEFLFYWILFDCSNREEGKFAQVLDLIRDTSLALYRTKLAHLNAEQETKKSIQAQQELTRQMERIEATTGLVQLLDSDEQIEVVMEKWLRTLGEQLQVESAELFQVNNNERTMNLLAQWCNRGVIAPFDRITGLDAGVLFQTEKPLVFSTGTIPGEHMWEANYYGWSAVMVFPVLKQDNGSNMVLTVEYRNGYHNWESSEIKFAADVVKVLQSILTRRIQKNSITGSHVAVETILDYVGTCIYVRDKSTGRQVFANKKLKNTFSAELENRTLDALVEQGLQYGMSGGTSEIFHEERSRWYEMTYKDTTWVDGKAVTLYSLYDITDRKLYQRKVEQQDYTDFLTGLYNRMCCERDLARCIEEAQKQRKIGAILYLDLDDFKHINDGLGHQYGDVLLRSVSQALQSVRGLAGRCYRMGGDDFVLLISPEVYDGFPQMLQDIQALFEKPWMLKDTEYPCTASMGLVTFPDHGEQVAELIKKADIAMREAKRNGKNQLSEYSDSLRSESGRMLDMERNMQDAAQEGCDEFEIYFQPIMDTQRDKPECAGAEALLRWNSARQGIIAPADFIPLAEYLGFIQPIGSHVLAEACKYCRRWNEDGRPDFRVHVNLSMVQLLQNNIVDEVERALHETGLRPSNLVLEVTESLAINDIGRMKEILGRMKDLGVKIALDDFGTGYASLSHIRELPVDLIKVDQSFVKELAEDAYAQSFIRMVAELARTIGVSVCAEGIEGPAQYKKLYGMHVRYVQGYYFDKPMPRKQFEEKYVL
ncbi:MAG: bifunctional diguanylate cyclase/phosphodiesterase [Lachnospiraceae bacterium]|nr:bifunctional diguanylate cyclase/phosphodiesterase [Lachnospiraceae bacterium]